MLVRARSEARSAVPGRAQRRHALVVLTLGALLGACGDDVDEQSQKPSNKPRGYTAPTGAGRVDEQEAAAAPTAAAPRRPRPTEPIEAPAREADKKEEEKPRDYPAELLAAMRGAEACVQPRPASQVLPELSVSLEGLVLESGTVVTGSARAGALTPEELDCMKRRLESTRLPPGVKDAPRRVNASLLLTRPPTAAPQPGAGGAQTGGATAPAPVPTTPAAAAAPTPPNPNEDLPEPVAPGDQDQPEPIPAENQDPPEEVLPSQN